MRHAAMLSSLEMAGSVSPRSFALADQLAGDRDVTLMYSFLTLDVGHHHQY